MTKKVLPRKHYLEVFSLFKNIHLIEESFLLSTLDKNVILEFLKDRRFKIVSYGKNSILHFEGDLCNTSEIILKGKILIDRIDVFGNLLNIAELKEGEILGSNLLFSSNPYYPMTVTAQEPTIVLEIPKDLLLDLCFQNKEFLKRYLKLISDNAFVLGNKLKEHVNKTIRERLLNYLKFQSQRQDAYHIQLHTSKKVLAEKFGVQRTSLSRELKKMKEEGLIDFDNKSITVLDRNILK